MAKYFTMGQTVYYINPNGHVVIGNVVSINNSERYKIKVDFGRDISNFTENGFKDFTDDAPTLFQNHPILTPIDNKLIETFEDGELVLVRDFDEGQWQLTYYSKYMNGRHECYFQQSRTGYTAIWNQIQKYESNSLLSTATNNKL